MALVSEEPISQEVMSIVEIIGCIWSKVFITSEFGSCTHNNLKIFLISSI